MSGKLFQASDAFIPIYDRLNELTKIHFDKAKILTLLQHFQDEWECKAEDGDVDGFVAGFEILFLLPDFAPDDWIRRNFLIRGARISPSVTNVSRKIELTFKEVCSCFIYGHFYASCALASHSISLVS